MYKNSESSDHNAPDQRSWDCKVNWRDYDIAIDCGANRFPWLRYAWCDDCVCIEKTSRQACSLPHKGKCRTAAWDTTDSHEEDKLRTWSMSISVQLEPMKRYKDSQTCSQEVYRMTTSKISSLDGIKLYYQWVKCLPKWSWKDCTSQKKQDSVQLQTVLALYDQDTARNNGKPNYSQLKTAVKLQIDQMMRTRNFLVQNDVVERGAVTKSQKGKKAYVERKVGECFQWKAHGQCSKGDSCGFSHDKLVQGDLYGGQRRKGRSSAPAPNSKAKTDGEEGNRDELSDKRNQILCRYKNCKNPSCKFWHLPVCQNHKRKDQLHYWRSLHNWVVYLKNSCPRKSFLREPGKLGSQHAVKFSKGTWRQIKKFGKERVHREDLSQKCAPHERSPCAPKFEERSHEESSRIGTKLRFTLLLAGAHFEKTIGENS